jgi:hypothetical protein
VKVETAAFVVRVVCMTLAFSFAFLSFRTVADALKRQFAVMAASPLVAGIMILIFLCVYWKMKPA